MTPTPTDAMNVLICTSCGATSKNVAQDPHAWDGWYCTAKGWICPDHDDDLPADDVERLR